MSGQRKALIIANDEYEQEALHNLLAPAADAEALGRVLGDRQIGDFTVQVVQNEPSYVVQGQIEDLFSESRPDDVLLLHFSGHGLKSESGELFFAASNTRPNRLGSTAVAADFVRRCMRDSRSRSVVLLLDCCYGGAFPQGATARAAGDAHVLDSFPQGRSGGRGRAVITASNAIEYAFEGDRLADDQHRRPSVFTSALVEGLATGDADRDEDGFVSLNELYEYVFDKVQEQNPHQTPSRQVEMEGELYLARSRRRRIRPARIPPDLQAAMTDQNMYTRRGAVHELESRLASVDLPVAAGAYEALAGLARTDIAYVADLAGAALGQAAIRPEEAELHFGDQRQGSEPPHRIVGLLGPPIARACVPRVSDDWIRVNETTEGFDISVDTTSTGTLRGSVELKGPTGTAVIAVDVELLPQAAQAAPTRRPSRPADQSIVAPATPADQPKERPAGDRQESRQAVKEWTAAQSGQGTPRAAESQEVKSHRVPAPTADESATAPQATTPATPSAAQPPIRRRAAFVGTVIALLAGVAEVISYVLSHNSYSSYYYYYAYFSYRPGDNFAFRLEVFLVAIVVALIALIQRYRLVVIGFLQGMWWISAAGLAAAIVSVGHLTHQPVRSLVAYALELTGFALGILAVVLLMVSWSPAVDRHRGPRIRAIRLMLLGAVGLYQIVALTFYVTEGRRWAGRALSPYLYSPYYYTLGSVGVLVVLAGTWYAISLRPRALGGALVLGWVTVAAFMLMGWITSWSRDTGPERLYLVSECVLLAAVIVLTIIYVRGPSEIEGSASKSV
jgi:hypothetical protein